MTLMNDLFRSYGKFDVVAGSFSFYSELKARDGNIEGYVKPLFKGMDVYDRRQDRENRSSASSTRCWSEASRASSGTARGSRW